MLVSVANIDIRFILYKLRVQWIGWQHSHTQSVVCEPTWGRGGTHHTMVFIFVFFTYYHIFIWYSQAMLYTQRASKSYVY